MTEPDPSPAGQIDALSQEFDLVWKLGRTPHIEEVLLRIAAVHRGELFRELLKLELLHLARRGERVSREEYLERFPDQREPIDALLLPEQEPTRRWPSSGGVCVRCPHCHQQLEILPNESLKDVTCTSCGSSFNLLADLETLNQSGGHGERVGQFELHETLGTGAFGTVWKARDTLLDRLVACKIPRSGALTEDEREKFFREARAAAQLRHEHIVSVHEVGRDGDTIYIISDYVEGLTLADWLTGQQPSVREAAEIVRKVALALDHAHGKGIIHRDIKPSNIMLDADLRPHVMDFGLAKREAGEITMTATGAILGTPAYMSPEQAQGDGHEVDARSDVYSLGVILYELLTGERPFRGNTRMLLHQVLRDEPPAPRKLNAAIPRDLETISLKCLEKDPHKRYPSARALAEELQHWLTGHPISARPMSRLERLWRWARRNPTLAASLSVISLLLLILSIGGPLMAWQQAELRATVEEANSSLDEANTDLQQSLQNETALKNNLQESLHNETRLKTSLETALQNETESKNIAMRRLYVSLVAQVNAYLLAGDHRSAAETLQRIPFDQRGWEARYLSRQASGTPLTLRGHQVCASSVAFSPDGRRIVSGGWDHMLKVWDAWSGEELLTLRGHEDAVNTVAFSPDGTRIVSGSDDDTLKVWDARTGQELLTLRGHQDAVECLAFTPDGTRIISGGYDKTLKVWDAQSGEELITLEGRQNTILSLAVSPDGTRIVSGSKVPVIKVWESRIGEDLYSLRGHRSSVHRVAFSPDGTRLVSSSWDKTVRVWDAGTGALLLALPGHEVFVWNVAFSPDGKRVISGGGKDVLNVWDARSGKLIQSEPWSVTRFQELASRAKTRPGPVRAIPDDNDILLIRQNPDFDPWAEDAARREHWGVAWHTADADKAEQVKDWFAAQFHLRWLAKRKPQDQSLKDRLQLAEAAWQAQQTRPFVPAGDTTQTSPPLPESPVEAPRP